MDRILRRRIRTVVMEVAAAAGGMRDISPEMTARAEASRDVASRTLFSVAADERFTGTAKPRRDWQKRAEDGLVRLLSEVEKMQEQGTVGEEDIKNVVEEYFVWWLSEMIERRAIEKESDPDLDELPYIPKDNDFDSIRLSNYTDKNASDRVSVNPDRMEHNGEESGTFTKREDESKDDNLQEACNRFMNPPKTHQMDSDNFKDGQSKTVYSSSTYGQEIELMLLRSLPSNLYRLAKIIGRTADKASSASSSKFMTASKSDIVGITVGNDLNALLPSEIATLATPQSISVFYRNFAEKRLQVFASASSDKDPKKHEEGPIIVCLDTSSSMNGIPVRVATAVTLALSILARRKKREVLIVRYSNSYDLMRVTNIIRQRTKLHHFLTHVDSSGNNENVMFRWLFGEIIPQIEDFKNADILCVSDFGWTPIAQDVKDLFEEYRKTGMRCYGLNIGNYQPDEKVNLKNTMDVLDSVWTYWRGNCFESYRRKGFNMKK